MANITQKDYELLEQDFHRLLAQRITRTRKNEAGPLQQFSYGLAYCVSIVPPDTQTIFLLTIHEKIDKILKDCEVFFNMPMDKAMDALMELSHLASLFVHQHGYEHEYFRICQQIKTIQSSYPLQS